MNNYLEVDPPLLCEEYLPEISIDVFTTRFSHPFRGNRKLYLLPSPEYWMKILLARGYGNIYSLSHVFRNSESLTRIHNPEFTLLEWYAVDKNYLDNLEVTENLFTYLSDTLPADLSPPFRRMTMHEAWDEIVHLDLDKLVSLESMQEACKKLEIEPKSTDSWESLFFKIFIGEIENKLPMDKPLALLDYPAALPCTGLKRGNVYERWELYIRGVEVCNCYTENHLKEDFSVFLENEKKHLNSAGRTGAAGSDYANRHLEDFPLCSGNALGFDRLVMLLSGQSSLEGVIFFPFSDML